MPTSGTDKYRAHYKGINSLVPNSLNMEHSVKPEGIIRIDPTHAFYRLLPYEQGHSKRLANFFYKHYEKKGYSPLQCYIKSLFAMWHDIGKIPIDPKIRDPKRKFQNLEEKRIMRKHPIYGLFIIMNDRVLQKNVERVDDEIFDIIFFHEKYDGTGYPAGYSGDQIPEIARVGKVFDDFDSVVDKDREYNGTHPPDECMEMLREKSGEYYDPEILDFALNEVMTKEFLTRLYPYWF